MPARDGFGWEEEEEELLWFPRWDELDCLEEGANLVDLSSCCNVGCLAGWEPWLWPPRLWVGWPRPLSPRRPAPLGGDFRKKVWVTVEVEDEEDELVEVITKSAGGMASSSSPAIVNYMLQVNHAANDIQFYHLHSLDQFRRYIPFLPDSHELLGMTEVHTIHQYTQLITIHS